MTGSIPTPWVLVDDDTARHTILLLQRLTGWLEASDTRSAACCAIALSNGETDDPITIANWSDGLALELEHRVMIAVIDPEPDA